MTIFLVSFSICDLSSILMQIFDRVVSREAQVGAICASFTNLLQTSLPRLLNQTYLPWYMLYTHDFLLVASQVFLSFEFGNFYINVHGLYTYLHVDVHAILVHGIIMYLFGLWYLSWWLHAGYLFCYMDGPRFGIWHTNGNGNLATVNWWETEYYLTEAIA